MPESDCSIENCDSKIHARGWCKKHYERNRVHGDPNHFPYGKGPWERIQKRITVTPSGCWICSLGVCTSGYAQVRQNGRFLMAHRISYEHNVGPIPTGLQLDHLCRVRNCVNPSHLEPVTQKENMARGNSPSAIRARASRGV